MKGSNRAGLERSGNGESIPPVQRVATGRPVKEDVHQPLKTTSLLSSAGSTKAMRQCDFAVTVTTTRSVHGRSEESLHGE